MNLSEQPWQSQPHMLERALPSVTLRSGISSSLSAFDNWREFIKLGGRALVHRKTTRQWLGFLNSHPGFSDLVRASPRLVQKIYKPYLSMNIDVKGRFALIASHYRFMLQRDLGPLVVRAANGGVLLASVEGKTGVVYDLCLKAVEPLEREGELVLELRHGADMVYCAGFTFSDLGGHASVSIGCIQGPKVANGLDLVRLATRELHGARPKQLVVNLIRQLAHELGCTQMRLVGNDNRVVLRSIRQRRVLADYDQFWTEMGATQRADGDFELDCSLPVTLDLEQVASKKRSEARKRHELLGTLSSAIRAQLAPAAPGQH